MELLKKSVSDKTDRRKDNSDKKPLFEKGRHPRTASFYKEQWAFVEDVGLRENIAYQMQYIEFMVYLYNDYQIYLTIESLICKDIIVAVGGIVEAALFDGIETSRKKLGLNMSERTDFTVLLGQAYNEYGLLNKDLWHFFHDLRKVRNNVHLRAADFKEHTAYTVSQANECLEKLEEFRKGLSGE
ncbi:MAG: hypothetical protein Q7S36_00960 [Candidatus Liptonbacteria bacterium]|nr:hypothetical protein [Candidatus Liptonbacteria bacterium]